MSVDFSGYCKRIFENTSSYSMVPACAMVKMSTSKNVAGCKRFIWGSAASLTAIISLPLICIETLAKIALGGIAKLFFCSQKAKDVSGFCFKHIHKQIAAIPVVLFMVALPVKTIRGNFCKPVKTDSEM